MWLILILSLFYTAPVFAQETYWINCNGSHTADCEKVIKQDTISQRIQQLEAEKLKLEEIYKELMVRIDELKQIIVPAKDKTEAKEDK